MTPLYIFDLDGTLALTEHRQGLVKFGVGSRVNVPAFGGGRVLEVGGVNSQVVTILLDDPSKASHADGTVVLLDGDCEWRPDWRAFFKACVLDAPNRPVIATFNALLKSGADIWIWSGRSAEVMNETRQWIQHYVVGDVDADEVQLMMRREGDHTPDEKLKLSWLQEMNDFDRQRLVAIFDDRDKVVAMWRAHGVPCFQVAPGAF